MTDRIHVLSPLLANQIAAGEVVERPASIVKELVENSLDAGATQIRIYLEKGGTQRVRVEDNGRGIDPEDMLLALSAHATSKITSPADLAQIRTLGFRGEALASIASVSRLTLTSCRAPHEACSVHVEGRDMTPVVKPASHPQGTTVDVQQLFFNTPARAKFLKSERTEYLMAEETLKRMVMVHPQVSFQLFHDKKCTKRYDTAQTHGLRAQQVLSRAFMEQSTPVDASITQMRLHGWLGAPDEARSSQDQAFFYVNGRALRDKVLLHAVRAAYGERLFPGRFPSYILFLECDPASVDVNVHPTKHEVRFREARLVHDFIMSSLDLALQGNAMPSRMEPQQTMHEPVVKTSMPLFQQTMPKLPASVSSMGTVLALLSRSVLVTQKDDVLYAIDWQKTLTACAMKRFEDTNTSVPLLEPWVLPATISPAWVEQAQALGFEIQCVGKAQYLLRSVPLCFQGMDRAHFNVDTVSTPEAIVQRFAQAWALSHPVDHARITQSLIMCEAILGMSGIMYRQFLPSDLI